MAPLCKCDRHIGVKSIGNGMISLVFGRLRTVSSLVVAASLRSQTSQPNLILVRRRGLSTKLFVTGNLLQANYSPSSRCYKFAIGVSLG
ncbi:hypothetical protein QUB63_14450 [Microcoleus sp. ARI1-B5]|uniref:hypothetical protein n=1 Tax=unclassified Microcoleus TaxID=2642155 RepID=UPI002FD42AAE